MKIVYHHFFLFTFLCLSCQHSSKESIGQQVKKEHWGNVSLVILGSLQDGGSPHIGCQKNCCKSVFKDPDPSRQVVSLGIVDPITKQSFLIEATPDLPRQLKTLHEFSEFKDNDMPDGIFLTHAHIGHYSGLMYLGKEAMNALQIPVYTMPRMKQFIESNGPWSQLVKFNNVVLKEIQSDSSIALGLRVKVTALRVPHRDEFSETVGFVIEGPNKKVLFIPDIDKWSKWNKNILEEIQKVDHAFIDGTFFDGKEINHRKISEIPHPFVIESMELFKNLEPSQKSKIYFIHFNHTNPLLDPSSEESKILKKSGFNAAQKGQIFDL